MTKEKTEEEIGEFMQDFFVTYEPQKYQAYPCHITEFQEECITEKLKELLTARDTYWKERVVDINKSFVGFMESFVENGDNAIDLESLEEWRQHTLLDNLK